MKKRSILILLGVFIALVLLAVLIEGLGKRRGKSDEEAILFPEFEADQVASVEIKTGDRNVTLIKEGGEWLVATADNYPADQEAVEEMLETVGELKSTLIASKSANKHAQFEVDEVTGVNVIMRGADNNVIAHFYVGKMGSDFMSTYFRKAGQEVVLQVDGYRKSIFDKGTRGWRDRTIFDFETDQVQKLTMVSQENGEIVLEASGNGGWQITKPEPHPAKTEEVDKILREISKLEADDFAEKKEMPDQAEDAEQTEQPVDPLAEYNLDKPQSTLTVDMKDGSIRTLLAADESSYRKYVKRGDKDTIFLLSKSKFDRIFKPLDDLKAEPEEAETDTESQPEETPPETTP